MITGWEKRGIIYGSFVRTGYLPILQKQEKHLIKIKRQAIVQKETCDISLPDRTKPPPGEGSLSFGWEGTVVFLWR